MLPRPRVLTKESPAWDAWWHVQEIFQSVWMRNLSRHVEGLNIPLTRVTLRREGSLALLWTCAVRDVWVNHPISLTHVGVVGLPSLLVRWVSFCCCAPGREARSMSVNNNNQTTTTRPCARRRPRQLWHAVQLILNSYEWCTSLQQCIEHCNIIDTYILPYAMQCNTKCFLK